MSNGKSSSNSGRPLLATAKATVGQILSLGDRVRRLHSDAQAAILGGVVGCLVTALFSSRLPGMLVPVLAAVVSLGCAVIAVWVRQTISRDRQRVRDQENLEELLSLAEEMKNAPLDEQKNYWSLVRKALERRFDKSPGLRIEPVPSRSRIVAPPPPADDPTKPPANDEPPDDEPTPRARKALKKATR